MNDKPVVWIINHYAIPPSLGGLNRHYYFKKYLERMGYKVRIFTCARIHNSEVDLSDNNQLFTEKTVDGEEYVFVKSPAYRGNGVSRIINMFSFAMSVRKIWSHYKSDNPSVIYTSSPDLFTAMAAQRLAKRHGLPNVVEIRDLWPMSIVEYKGVPECNPVIKLLYKLEKHLYVNASAIVFTFPGGRDYILDWKWDNDVRLDKIFYINNGVDVESSVENGHEAIYQDADLENEKFKVVYCGSVREANHVDLLVDAANELREEKDIEFLVFGNGTAKDALENRAKMLGLENIHFKGHVEKKYVPYILSKASLNVLTYKQAATWKYGGSQNKLFDYLYSGVPVITNIKMGHSVLSEYSCGIECESENPKDFAEAIMKVFELDSCEYERMCDNARSAALNFDYKLLTDKLVSVIETVTGGGRAN